MSEWILSTVNAAFAPRTISCIGKITGVGTEEEGGKKKKNGKKVEMRGTIGIARGRSSTRNPVDVVVVVGVADVPWLWEKVGHLRWSTKS
ncbi:hypothetical protein F1880_008104 [Penicillium rolfsii]|nr:hypothetical protein F1880_008104 [Penicillium rolfsii]